MLKMNRKSLDFLIKIAPLVCIPILILPLFINFDSHHDGLVLTTILELRKSLEVGGTWPFNQYGQLWAFPMVGVSYLVNDEFLFLSLRLLTLCYYLLNALLILIVSKRFLSGNLRNVPVFLYLLAQPFSLGLNSTFLPWPSALCSLLVMTILALSTKNSESLPARHLSLAFAGATTFLILGTRFQVGVLILASLSMLFFLHRRLHELFFFISGFLLTLLLVEGYFFSQGWLRDSLYDSIVFSSQYVSGDTSTYPIPKVTLLLSVLMCAILFAVDSFTRRSRLLGIVSSNTVLISLSFTLVALLFFAISSEMTFQSWLTLFIRRFWISAAISFLIYSLFTLFRLLKSSNFQFNNANLNAHILAVISISSFSQIAPLFDQMHFWWGLSPSLIFILFMFHERFSRQPGYSHLGKLSLALVGSLLIAFNIVGTVIQVNSVSEKMDSRIASGIYLADATDNRIAEFLNDNVHPRQSVLNLCPNSNIYFSAKSSNSTIREFVLWSPTLDFSEYKDDFLNSKPDLIISCPLSNPHDSGQIKVNESIQLILDAFQTQQQNSFLDDHGRKWIIYSAGK